MVRKRIKKAVSKVKKGLSKVKKKAKVPKVASMPRSLGGRLGFGRGFLPPWVTIPMLSYDAYNYLAPIARREGYQDRATFDDWYERQRFNYFPESEIDPDSDWIMPEGYAQSPRMPMQEEPVKQARKVSKANKATKKAWKMLTKGVKGKLTQDKCRKLLKKCATMASKANPNTKSRIGKGKSKMCKDCRKIRKEIWGTTKRY